MFFPRSPLLNGLFHGMIKRRAKAWYYTQRSILKMKASRIENNTPAAILLHMLLSAVSLMVNGFGVYLTIHANIGAGPWDVFNLGLSHTFGILYGTASITVSALVLLMDLILGEPIGIAMIIDAVVVGKSVDLFNALNLIPIPETLPGGLLMMLTGLPIMGYTQFLYMRCALGCGPRDTLLVGLKRRCRRIPIGVVSILILSAVTLTGFLLGGQVGIGTLVCAFLSGPVMQGCFRLAKFDATAVRHQSIPGSIRVFRAFIKGKKDTLSS